MSPLPCLLPGLLPGRSQSQLNPAHPSALTEQPQPHPSLLVPCKDSTASGVPAPLHVGLVRCASSSHGFLLCLQLKTVTTKVASTTHCNRHLHNGLGTVLGGIGGVAVRCILVKKERLTRSSVTWREQHYRKDSQPINLTPSFTRAAHDLPFPLGLRSGIIRALFFALHDAPYLSNLMSTSSTQTLESEVRLSVQTLV